MEAAPGHLEHLDAGGLEVIEAGAQLPSIADGVERQLDPRFIPLQRIVGQITTACLSVGGLVALVVLVISSSMALLGALVLLIAWALATGALAWLSHRWPELEYRHSAYRVDAEGMQIRNGVYWRHVINVPRSRVQHTDVTQGPLQRQFGLGTLLIHTAGTEHAQVTLPGLAHETALQIRDHLLPRERVDAV
ncbi:MAG TPA: PH domain-containing protein [Longimicrobiales bacterium]|nr:PH domain-containing protein [Longimicrobiales bacterium]